MRRAVGHYFRSGEKRRAGIALRNLAWHVHLERGPLDLVIATFDRIEAEVGGESDLVWRTNRAEAQLLLGDTAAAAHDLAEVTRPGEVSGDDMALSYAARMTAQLESMREEPLPTLAAVGRADHLAGDWFATTTGVLFLA